MLRKSEIKEESLESSATDVNEPLQSKRRKHEDTENIVKGSPIKRQKFGNGATASDQMDMSPLYCETLSDSSPESAPNTSHYTNTIPVSSSTDSHFMLYLDSKLSRLPEQERFDIELEILTLVNSKMKTIGTSKV